MGNSSINQEVLFIATAYLSVPFPALFHTQLLHQKLNIITMNAANSS